MAKVSMTRREILLLDDGLKRANLTGREFTYVVKSNKIVVAPKAKAIRESTEPDKGYEAFTNDLNDLNTSMARVDNDGNPVTFRQRGRITYDIPGLGVPGSPYDNKVKKLKERHREVVIAWEAKERENEKWLEEKENIELMMINFKLVPQNTPQDVMDGIFFMIKKVDPKEFE
jgi:hypothetical protein